METRGLEKLVLRSPAWGVIARRAILPWTLRVADLPPRAETLELGSGAGFTAEALLERFPGWRLTVTDHDPDMVELARARLARFGDRVRVERADAAALPYLDGSFDLVYAILVWHHVEAWERATAEAARVLRPGGQLLLVDVVRPRFARRLPLHATYTLPDLERALRAAGFGRVRKAAGPLWYRLLARSPSPASARPATGSTG
ncbi:MAG TPA: class I SAM-dependent methyltransferase [Actinomycetota bacterium]|nr:class I SAM-dependent methyltransferase [Actinomycetota bacterium]